MMKSRFVSRLHLAKQIYMLAPFDYWKIIVIFGLTLVLSITEIFPTVLYQIFIDVVLISQHIEMLPFVLLGYLVNLIVFTSLSVCREKRKHSFFIPYLVALQSRLLRIILHLPNTDQFSDADLRIRLESDVNTVERFLLTHICQYAHTVSLCILSTLLMISISWKLLIVGQTVLFLSLACIRFVGKKISRVSECHHQVRNEFEDFVYSSMINWKEVKTSNLLPLFVQQLSKKHHHLANLFLQSQNAWFLGRLLSKINEHIVTNIFIYLVGGLLVITNQLEVGRLLAFASFFDIFAKNISQIIDSYLGLKKDVPAILRIIDLLKQKRRITKTDIPDTNIQLQNIDFKYTHDTKPLFTGLSFSLQPNEHIMMIGNSGCGKSTLAKLIARVYHPSAGRILYGGMDIAQLDYDQIATTVTLVNQESHLFHLSIRDNLLLANPYANNEQLWEACRLAGIAHEIAELPQGMDTVIGEKGVKLSGGQQQRLIIARAIIKDTKVIILDEALNSIDSQSELTIVKSLLAKSVTKSVLVITHNMECKKLFDRAICLSNGILSEASGSVLG